MTVVVDPALLARPGSQSSNAVCSSALHALRPLRVIVAHNGYQLRGGEDSVVEAEVALLRQHGHEVVEYRRSNHEIEAMGAAAAAAQTLWSRRTVSEMRTLFAEIQPDVLHVHNTFPLISPSIYWTAGHSGVPVVQTLHNFRLLCPQGMLLRDGRICEDCVGKPPWRGALHRCYRDSAAQSAVLAGMLFAHHAAGTWQHKITRYIALNDFCRDKFIEGGLPADKVVVKPNFIDLPAPDTAARDGFLFVGRLSPEKGVEVLAEAVRCTPGAQLQVAGIGPEQHRLENLAGVEMLGAMQPAAVYDRMRAARALVLPSIWYENFPRTLVEAFACGLAAIASNIGALAQLVTDGVTGLLFKPGDPVDLAHKLAWANANPARMAEMGANARAEYQARWTGVANYRLLLDIYNQALRQPGGTVLR